MSRVIIGDKLQPINITLPLDDMSTDEKLRVMEALWADLSRHEEAFESPGWHADVLRAREERVKSGQEAFVEWEAAKRELRNRLA